MLSVVIAAHNEENVIGPSLDALLHQRQSVPMEIIVSANGCTDQTAAVARRRGVAVIERAEAGKAEALNAGDRVATGFPRIYLDADIVIPPGGLEALIKCFAQDPHPLAVAPRRQVNTVGRPWPVRAYFAINEQLPTFRSSLFGRGMIALSEEGWQRFESFPAMIADDLYIDSLFSESEKVEASGVGTVVEAPFTTRALVRRLVRVRRGNAQLRAQTPALASRQVRSSDRWAWLKYVVLRDPRLASAALPYVSITLVASLLARRRTGYIWARDESTRATQKPTGNEASV